jgi:hypothetical protein
MMPDDTDDQAQEAPAAPRPMPWGQLVLGAIVGGVATWMILLNQNGVAPSSMLAGVAEAYQATRDAMLTPVAEALGVQLSPAYRDALALLAVFFAAIVRTSLRYPGAWWIIAFAVILGTLAAARLAYFPRPWPPTTTDMAEFWIWRALLFTILITTLAPLAGLIGRVMDPTARAFDDLTAPHAMLTLWNVVAIAALAGALFFVSWAAA